MISLQRYSLCPNISNIGINQKCLFWGKNLVIKPGAPSVNNFDVITARALLEQDHVNECLDVLCSVCNMTSEHDVTAQVHALVGDYFSRQVETLASNIRSLQWAATESFHDTFYK